MSAAADRAAEASYVEQAERLRQARELRKGDDNGTDSAEAEARFFAAFNGDVRMDIHGTDGTGPSVVEDPEESIRYSESWREGDDH